MRTLGVRQRGRELPLVLQCVDEDGQPADPASSPVATVVGPGGFVVRRRMGADLRQAQAGLFRLPLFAGDGWPAEGNFRVHFVYATQAGTQMAEAAGFLLVAGGDPAGAVIAMHGLLRQNSIQLVQQTDAGLLLKSTNPR